MTFPIGKAMNRNLTLDEAIGAYRSFDRRAAGWTKGELRIAA